MSVGVIVNGLDDEQRHQATPPTSPTAPTTSSASDYLRDNMKYDMSQMVQRGYATPSFEKSTLLVDEARTPLIISGPVGGSLRPLRERRRVDPESGARRLRHRRVAAFGEPDRSRQRARRGVAARRRADEGGLPYESRHATLVHQSIRLLRAHKLFQLDKDTSFATAKS